jgi:hypothetical protein
MKIKVKFERFNWSKYPTLREEISVMVDRDATEDEIWKALFQKKQAKTKQGWSSWLSMPSYKNP